MFLSAFGISALEERAAIAAGDDLRGLGICHQQAFWGNSGNGISPKYAILRKIALLANFFFEKMNLTFQLLPAIISVVYIADIYH